MNAPHKILLLVILALALSGCGNDSANVDHGQLSITSDIYYSTDSGATWPGMNSYSFPCDGVIRGISYSPGINRLSAAFSLVHADGVQPSEAVWDVGFGVTPATGPNESGLYTAPGTYRITAFAAGKTCVFDLTIL